jgi:hypothetical protein
MLEIVFVFYDDHNDRLGQVQSIQPQKYRNSPSQSKFSKLKRSYGRIPISHLAFSF